MNKMEPSISAINDSLSIPNLNKTTYGLSTGGSNCSSNKASQIDNKIYYKFTIIIVGDICVGKTSLFYRISEKRFSDDYISTCNIGSTITNLKLNEDTIVDLELFDTCGEEKFRSLTKLFLRQGQAAIIMFDLTNEKSFMDLDYWVNEITNSNNNSEVIIVGNKSDLNDRREINHFQGKEYASQHNMEYLEISVLSGTNVQLLFEKLALKLIQRQIDNESAKKQEEEENNSVDNAKEHLKDEKQIDDGFCPKGLGLCC